MEFGRSGYSESLFRLYHPGGHHIQIFALRANWVMPGEKAINITTQGGAHSEDAATAQEHGNSYIKTMLNFFGIEDYKCVSASKLDIIGMDVEAIVNKAIEEAKELAKSF